MELKIELLNRAKETPGKEMEEALAKSVAELSAGIAKKESLEVESSMKTKSYREEIEKIQHKIDSIQTPYYDQIQECNKDNRVLDAVNRENEKVCKIQHALELLKKGITDVKGATDFLKDLYGYNLYGKTIRILSHKRGKDIVVLGVTSQYKDTVDYIAINNKKHAIVSMLHVDKAKHAGDTTYTYSTPYTALTKRERIYSREGLSMREWINPTIIKWDEVTDENLVKLINKHDSF